MRASLAILAIVGAALAVAALAVFGLEDGATLVPPAEAQVEGFMRAMSTRRFSRARAYLEPALASRTSVSDLRERQARLERAIGRVHDVRGEARARERGRAEAVAWLKTEGGEVPLGFALARMSGEWRITSLKAFDGTADLAP